MKRARQMLWIIPLVLALAAGGCSTSDEQAGSGARRQFPRRQRHASGRNGHPAVGHRSGGVGRHHHLRQLPRRRHDPAHDRRRGALDPQGRGLRQQRLLGLSGAGLRQVGPLRPQEPDHRRLGPAERDHDQVGRRRREPRPGPGRLRRPDDEERDHRVGLFGRPRPSPAGPSRTPWPGAAVSRSGARRGSPTARSPATPASANPGPPATAAPTAAASTPTGSTSATASSAATRPSPTGPAAAASIRSAAGPTRPATATTRRSPAARSAATGSRPSMPTAAASSPCPAARTTWPR